MGLRAGLVNGRNVRREDEGAVAPDRRPGSAQVNVWSLATGFTAGSRAVRPAAVVT